MEAFSNMQGMSVQPKIFNTGIFSLRGFPLFLSSAAGKIDGPVIRKAAVLLEAQKLRKIKVGESMSNQTSTEHANREI